MLLSALAAGLLAAGGPAPAPDGAAQVSPAAPDGPAEVPPAAAPDQAGGAPRAGAGDRGGAGGTEETLEARQQERVAAAREFQYRCVRSIGHGDFCRCLDARRPEAVDFDAFVLFTSRSREELGYERLSPVDRKLVDGALEARNDCVELMGWN